ncbi:MAG: hypothetical protein KIT43_13940 [Bauldia sp.]|nr:hypothetical protein [Bauldia sp.]MCW5716621.1 hypothetical protein [Bauldia sp.]
MLRRSILASAGFLAASGIASAATLDGRWSYIAAECAAEISDAILVIDTVAGTMRYWESECTLTMLQPFGTFETAWRVQMGCTGEGEFWDRDAIFAIDVPADGDGTPRLIEIDLTDGYVVTRAWCGEAAPAGAK